MTPAGLAHSGLTIAALRAGAIGILSTEFLSADQLDRAEANARTLVQEARFRGNCLCGVRLAVSELRSSARILDTFAAIPHLLILGGWTSGDLAALVSDLQSPLRQLWLEAGSGKQIEAAAGISGFQAWVARGEESGGWCGRESAFVLCQRLAKQSLPFYIQGGIGPQTAAACKVAGAAGVVVDDVLLSLRESPFGPRELALLHGIANQNTVMIQGPGGDAIRVGNYPGSQAVRQLHEVAGQAESAAEWHQAAAGLCGWNLSRGQALPLGETSGRALRTAQEYGSVGRLVRAIQQSSVASACLAACLQPISPGSSLAESHQTRFPIVQGPMARFSDTVPFALAVASAGALPLLALSTMSHNEIERLLAEAQSRLDGQSWGVGLLGFTKPELLRDQLSVVTRIRPGFALIAGGRPDQAEELEAHGIATYLHAPVPETLRLYLARGVRRFVLEGAECGGHTGPLHSFFLWEESARVLLEIVPPADSSQIQILFAGGIHDALSAAMVSAIAAPLADRGMKIGVLLGTAYLFTHEAVATGAILGQFQKEALDSSETVLIETKPGHQIRCLPSAVIEAFHRHRAECLRAGLSVQETAESLNQFVTGRLRLAAKGIERVDGRLTEVSRGRQTAEGLYMAGQAASLRSSLQSCEQLHADVSSGASWLDRAVFAPEASAIPARPAQVPVAIVGIGCLLPGAQDPETFWRNMLDGKDLRREIPSSRWDWRLYYDPDPAAPDRIHSKWGCFLDPVEFDAVHFGIPPKSLASISLPQLAALELSRRALIDAGYGDSIAEASLRRRTAVYFGACSTADLDQLYKARTALPLCVEAASSATLERLPEWTEDAYPGILVNIIAGRVANRFDLGGANLTVDAACASSLAALDLAARDLDSGRADLVLAGAIELESSPQAFMAFSKTRALSPEGKAKVFDQGADGIVLGEGGVVLVLKRLSDAERDGDRVYAVLRGVAGASDGKGMGLTSPRPEGQVRAISRAYEQAGMSPAAIGYYEAHATGTQVGDRTELETIRGVLAGAGAKPGACATGSAKNLVGHTRAASGLVGLVKAALALYHRTLPHQTGVACPLAPLVDPKSPLFLLDAPSPWISGSGPRRAGVSAFGFGGTNFHAVLEEYPSVAPGFVTPEWPLELVTVSAGTPADLRAALGQLAAEAESARSLAGFAKKVVLEQTHAGLCRAAIIVKNLPELVEKARAVAGKLEDRADLARGVFVTLAAVTKGPADLAFLFPGQGSQYPGMGRELAIYSEDVHRSLELSGLAALICPPAAFSEAGKDAQALALADTKVAQPALASLSCGMLDLAARFGLHPGHTGGHSFGEFVALHAAKALDRGSLMKLARERGRILGGLAPDCGTMAAVAAPAERVRRTLDSSVNVSFANFNAPSEVVLSGTRRDIEAAIEKLEAAGMRARCLSVSVAFHSPVVQKARSPFEAFLRSEIQFSSPVIPVYSNLDGSPFPADPDSIRLRCAEQLEQSVDFVSVIEGMYKAGARTFLELGPKQVLTGLTGLILSDREHLAIPAGDGLRGWLSALARLFVAGHTVRFEALFEQRTTAPSGVRVSEKPAQPGGYWMDGGRIWQSGDSQPTVGRLPLLDRESADTHALTRLTPGDSCAPLADVYREYQETMRHFLEQQERVLTSVMGGAQEPMLPQPAEPPAVEPPPHARPAIKDASPNQQQLVAMLISLISERTGYSSAILDPGCDIEAVLGVDSLKRIEILCRLEDTLPPTWAARVRRKMDRLTRAKSVAAIASALLQEAEPLQFAPVIADREPGRGEEGCPRSVMSGTETALPTAVATPLSGLILVTEDALGVASRTVVGLRERGADAALFAGDSLASPELIQKHTEELRRSLGPVRGIVHLAALQYADEPGSLAEWRQATARTSKALFHLLQCCLTELGQDTVFRAIAVSRLGGDFGRGGMLAGSAATGGYHGLIQSAMKEYPRLLGKTIDFDSSLGADHIAQRVVSEVLFPGGGPEVGYPRGRRTIYTARPAPLPATGGTRNWKPGEGWVVLATGGAWGITAEICRELAQPGVRLIVVGRNEPKGDAARHLRMFQDNGAEVEFVRADVRSEEEFGAALHGIYERCGRLDAVLHGAGVIEDSGLRNKDAGAFGRVFDTKADSAFLLRKYLRPAGLKWVVMFGSVSGRFGNHGQVDYAAGNETMTRAACRMSADFPDTRVLVIHWGPWTGTGMAAKKAVNRLREQGMRPIEAAAGRRFFVEELSRGGREDVEVIAGHGPWLADGDPLLGSVLRYAAFLPQALGELVKGLRG
jgi:acyl transferase domain-containing protein/NAD(P)H-dependent flavin oxidoreductase YrpB (nitropropane dioxygenase family)/NAD(P)-dependent dehydrogenase (short-subunit alcohol dehydrogenase family)